MPTPAGWVVNAWVKSALVALGATGPLHPQPGSLPGTEFSSLGWIEDRSPEHRIPAGSFIRRSSYLSPGCVVMPPSTIQAGAWLGPSVKIDSHVLVGSCAQIGEGAILGSGSVVAGLLLPFDTLPAILERGVILAGNCGLYGSILIGEETILHPGTILQASNGLYDATSSSWVTAGPDLTLRVPPRAELTMGLPPAADSANGIQRLTAMIVRRESSA